MKPTGKPQIEWRDLLHLNRRQIAFNVLLSLPFLAASWLFAAYGQYLAALVMSFFFFTCASWGAKVLDVEEVLPVSRRQLSAIRRILREGA